MSDHRPLDTVADLLPHAECAILIDKLMDLQPGSHATASKIFYENDPVFAGHFPDNPILPGHILIELFAQLSGLLLGADASERFGYLAEVRQMRFYLVVHPGDEIVATSRLKVRTPSSALFELSACVGDACVASGRLALGGFSSR